MLVEHEKISGQTNGDPDEVGGEDWDKPHVLSSGSHVIVALATLSFSAGDLVSVEGPVNIPFDQYERDPGVNAYQLSIQMPFVREGKSLSPTIRQAWVNLPYPAIRCQIDNASIDPETNQMAMSLVFADATGDLCSPGTSVIELTVIATVV